MSRKHITNNLFKYDQQHPNLLGTYMGSKTVGYCLFLVCFSPVKKFHYGTSPFLSYLVWCSIKVAPAKMSDIPVHLLLRKQ